MAGSYDREQLRGAAKEQRLHDYLFQHPVPSVRMAQKHLDCSYNTADNAVRRLERLRILRESTGQERNRLYRYEPYLALFDRQILKLPVEKESRKTESNRSHAPRVAGPTTRRTPEEAACRGSGTTRKRSFGLHPGTQTWR